MVITYTSLLETAEDSHVEVEGIPQVLTYPRKLPISFNLTPRRPRLPFHFDEALLPGPPDDDPQGPSNTDAGHTHSVEEYETLAVSLTGTDQSHQPICQPHVQDLTSPLKRPRVSSKGLQPEENSQSNATYPRLLPGILREMEEKARNLNVRHNLEDQAPIERMILKCQCGFEGDDKCPTVSLSTRWTGLSCDTSTDPMQLLWDIATRSLLRLHRERAQKE